MNGSKPVPESGISTTGTPRNDTTMASSARVTSLSPRLSLSQAPQNKPGERPYGCTSNWTHPHPGELVPYRGVIMLAVIRATGGPVAVRGGGLPSAVAPSSALHPDLR